MKIRLATVLLIATASLLHATEPTVVDSRITDVTVFLDRAEVTRVAELEVDAGTSRLRFDELPDSLVAGSLRLDGAGGFTLVDLKYDSRLVKEDPNETLQALEEEKESLERSIREQERLLKRLDKETDLVQAITARFTTVPAEAPLPDPDPQTWRDLLAFQQEELARVDAARLDAENDYQDLKEELNRVMDEIRKLGAGWEKRVYSADAQIQMDQPGPVRLELRYVLYGASWRPAYDLRVDSAADTVDVTYFGEVKQSTGEDWEGVALRLSTAKPMVGGSPPELQLWFLRYMREIEEAKALRRRENEQGYLPTNTLSPTRLDSSIKDLPIPAEVITKDFIEQVAAVETGATAATFAVELPADVPADGSSSRVVLTQASFPAEFRHIAVPKLSPYAYLEAEATNSTDFPLLPGRAAVFLDGSYVAETRMDLVAPDEEFEVGLGVDEGVSVERKVVEDLADKTGIVRNKKKLRFAYQFELSNNKQEVIELVLRDQLPKSTDDSLKVELVEPRIRKDDSSVTIDEENFIEWTFTLKPGRTEETRLEYTVEFPEEKTVIGLP